MSFQLATCNLNKVVSRCLSAPDATLTQLLFRLQVVESSSLVSVLLREAFSHPYISFFHLLVNSFSVTCFRTFFAGPLPSLNWWAVSVGGEELKWHQLAHNQLMSPQGPQFSPHSTAKTNYKSTNFRKIGI